MAALIRFGRQLRQGDTFKIFVISYMGWRFFIDFFKPANRFLGISAIQFTCILLLLYYSRDLPRIARSLANRDLLAES
jgi:prolipoprotein diacylglyceryltransferase